MSHSYKDFIDELKEIKKIQDERTSKRVGNERYLFKPAWFLIAFLAIATIAYLV